MSSKQQVYGDSLRRQMDASRLYAERHNLELVETINGQELRDIGISAYNGNNANSGAFSVFLKLIQEDKIEKGSVLLVESLDRISRESLSKALPQFLDIINQGIEIVTLIDEQSYTQDKINQNASALYVSLAIMQRANEESEVKSKRLKSAWQNKRQNAGTEVVTKLAPYWIRYSEDKNVFELIPKHAETVKLIYDLCINTFGLYSITKYLNESKIKVFGKSAFWNRSYVKKILSNRSVFGEYQPCTIIDGKRIPSGEPILNYYPSVISEDTYYLAQSAIERRTKSQKGRKGNNLTNLFSGLTYCSHCGTKMNVRNRGEPPKGGKTLICRNKLMGAGCESIEWKLSDIENSILEHLKEVNFDEITSVNSDINLLEGKLARLDAEKNTQESKIKNIEDLLGQGALNSQGMELLIKNINQSTSELDEILGRIESVKKEISIINSSNISNKDSKELLNLVSQNHNDLLFRSKLNQLISKSVLKIELEHTKNLFLPYEISSDDAEVSDYLKLNPQKMNKTFNELLKDSDFERFVIKYYDRIKITYKSGVTRQIFPAMAYSIPFDLSRQSAKK